VLRPEAPARPSASSGAWFALEGRRAAVAHEHAEGAPPEGREADPGEPAAASAAHVAPERTGALGRQHRHELDHHIAVAAEPVLPAAEVVMRARLLFVIVAAALLLLPLVVFAADGPPEQGWFRWAVDGAAWLATTYGPLIGALVGLLAMVGRWLDSRFEKLGKRLEVCIHSAITQAPPVKILVVTEDGSPARVHVVPERAAG
jgi:uncharacterized integral membrane protein